MSFEEKFDQKMYQLGKKLGQKLSGNKGGKSGGTYHTNRTRYDYVYLGTFPQRAKDADVSIEEEIGGGIYRGSDGAMYCKREKGKDRDEYRAGLFTYAACFQPSAYSGSVTRYSNGEKIVDFFKMQPIKWYIIDSDGDTFTLMSSRVLFYETFKKKRSLGQSGVAWENSDVRATLNGDFLQTVFTDEERARILVTHLTHDTRFYSVAEKLSSASTYDRVYLISKDEIEKYGLKSDDLSKFQTDFAGPYADHIDPEAVQYLYSTWTTRTPYGTWESGGRADMYQILRSGALQLGNGDMGATAFYEFGVVPVIRVERSGLTVHSDRKPSTSGQAVETTPEKTPEEYAAELEAAERRREEQERQKQEEEKKLASPLPLSGKIIASVIAAVLWYLGMGIGSAVTPNSGGSLPGMLTFAFLAFVLVMTWTKRPAALIYVLVPCVFVLSLAVAIGFGISGSPF